MKKLQKLEDTLFTDENKSFMNVAQEIEKIALEKKIDLISAALELAKKLEWDPSWLGPYITGPLKEKIRIEGESQGLLKKSSQPKILFE